MAIRDYLDIALIIIAIFLVVLIVLQSKSAGLGGLTGGDTGGVFRVRRGVELLLFRLCVGASALFFAVAIAAVVWVR
jgi:protein translocase SecG subunit